MSVLVALLCAAAAPAANAPREVPCGSAKCLLYQTPRQAFEAVLAAKPAVLGVGEQHQLQGVSTAASSIRRFTEALLPALRGRASDLVAETWVTEGRCGKVEKQAVQAIVKETERPPETEGEVVALLKKAKALGLAPHILRLTCAQYARMLAPDGTLDGEKTLVLVAQLLAQQAEKLAAARRAKTVVIYGGALHNDLAPDEALADFSFGPSLARSTRGRYVELDLFVPEYICGDEDLSAEPWYPVAMDARTRGDSTLLALRRPGSYVLVFPASR